MNANRAHKKFFSAPVFAAIVTVATVCTIALSVPRTNVVRVPGATVYYDQQAGLPQATELSVEPVGETDASYQTYVDAALGAVRGTGEASAQAYDVRLYDISLLANGEELQPGSDVSVTLGVEGMRDGTSVQVVHFNEADEALVLPAKAHDGEVSFRTAGFSRFAVLTASAETTPATSATAQAQPKGQKENASASTTDGQTTDSGTQRKSQAEVEGAANENAASSPSAAQGDTANVNVQQNGVAANGSAQQDVSAQTATGQQPTQPSNDAAATQQNAAPAQPAEPQQVAIDQSEINRPQAGSLDCLVYSAERGESEGYIVRVTYGEDAGIPAGATLTVREINAAPDDPQTLEEQGRPYNTEVLIGRNEYNERVARLSKGLGIYRGRDRVFYSKLLYLALEINGEEIVPQAPLQVSIETNALYADESDFLEAGIFDGKKVEPLSLQNLTQVGGNPVIAYESDRLGEVGIVAAARAKLAWQVLDEEIYVQGAGTLDVRATPAAATGFETGVQLLAAFDLQMDAMPVYGTCLWIETRNVGGASSNQNATGGVVGYRLSGDQLAEQLFGASGTEEPVALQPGESIALAWDTGLRDNSVNLGDVTVAGLMPIGSAVVAEDVADEYGAPATLVGIDAAENEGVSTVAAYDLSVRTEDGDYVPEGEPLAVTIATDGAVAGAELEVWRVGENGAAEAVDATLADGVASFEATDTGTYLVTQRVVLERELTASDGRTYDVTVSYGHEAGVPADAQLQVRELEGTEREDYEERAAEALGDKLAYLRAFDITLAGPNGDEYEPAGPVEVSIRLKDDDARSDAQVVHFADEDEVVGAQAQETDDGVELTFTTDSFSVYAVAYTVDFHWGNYTYNMEGAGTILLSELLSILAENGGDAEAATAARLAQIAEHVEQVEGVTFSNPELVSVEKVQVLPDADAVEETDEDDEALLAQLLDDWLLTSLAPFDTDETLTVTLKDGESIDIAVTDERVDGNASGSRVTVDGVTYTLVNTLGTGTSTSSASDGKVYNGRATVYALTKGCTIHDEISYGGKLYKVWNIAIAAGNLQKIGAKMDRELVNRASGYKFGLPDIKTDITDAEKEQLAQDGFAFGASNDGSSNKLWKKATYNPETNSIEYEIKTFQAMKEDVPLDFIFIYDDSITMYTGDRGAPVNNAANDLNETVIREAQGTRLLILSAAQALMGKTKADGYDIRMAMGGASNGDARKSNWYTQGAEGYAQVETYLSTYATGVTSHSTGVNNALALAKQSVAAKRQPIVIYLSDFIDGGGVATFSTAANQLKGIADVYCLSTRENRTAPRLVAIASSGTNYIHTMSEISDGVKALETIIKDAIGYYMKDQVTVTDNLSDAMKNANATQGTVDTGSAPAGKGKSTWTLGGTSPYPGAGKIYTEKFSVKLDDDKVYAGSMPTNDKATVTVGGKQVNSIDPTDGANKDKLQKGGEVTFLLGQLDEKNNMNRDANGVPNTLVANTIKFTLSKAESDSQEDGADDEADGNADSSLIDTYEVVDGAFTIPYKKVVGEGEGQTEKVILELGHSYILSEVESTVNEYNAAGSRNPVNLDDPKLKAPDKNWILTVGTNGVISVEPEYAANQTPEVTIAKAVQGTPARFVLWNKIVVPAKLIPIELQKTWSGGEERASVPFTVYGVERSDDTEQGTVPGRRHKLIAYDGYNAETAKEVSYIGPGNKGFKQDGDVWTQTVFVLNEEDGHKFYDYENYVNLNELEDGTEITVGDLKLKKEQWADLDVDGDGKVPYGQSYSYAIEEGDVVYDYGWYTPSYGNNATATTMNIRQGNVPAQSGSGSKAWIDYVDDYNGTTSDWFFFELDVWHYNNFDSSFRSIAGNDGYINGNDELKNFFKRLRQIQAVIEDNGTYYRVTIPVSGEYDYRNYLNTDTDLYYTYGNALFPVRLPSSWQSKGSMSNNNGLITKDVLQIHEIQVTFTGSSNKLLLYSDGKTKSITGNDAAHVKDCDWGPFGPHQNYEHATAICVYDSAHSSSSTNHRIHMNDLVRGSNLNQQTLEIYEVKPAAPAQVIPATEYTLNSCTLSITNTWTPNPLVPMKVVKSWKNGETNADLTEADYNDEKKDITFSIKGTSSKGTKGVPIFEVQDDAWDSGASTGTLTGDKTSASWEDTVYVPKFDTSTYKRENEPNPCEEYTYDDNSIVEETDLNQLVSKDDDGQPRGEWTTTAKYKGNESGNSGDSGDSGSTQASDWTSYRLTMQSNGYGSGYGNAYTRYFSEDLYKNIQNIYVEISYRDNNGAQGKQWLGFGFNDPQNMVPSKGAQKGINIRGIKLPSSWTIEKTVTRLAVNGAEIPSDRFTYSSFADMSSDASSKEKYQYAQVRFLSDASWSGSGEYWVSYNTVEQAQAEKGTSFTLTNTFTPYKAVTLTSEFSDGSDDAGSTDAIRRVTYAIKQGDKVVRTTEAKVTNRRAEKTIYLPKGDYTITQSYSIGEETKQYALDGVLDAYDVQYKVGDGAYTDGTKYSDTINTDRTVAFKNERKNLPVTVQTRFDPQLESETVSDASKRPLGTNKSIKYDLRYFEASGTEKSAGNGALDDGTFVTADKNYRKSHDTSIPSYSVREEPVECRIDDSTGLDSVLPDYDCTIVPTEEQVGSQKNLVFTIEADVKRADVIINKLWEGIDKARYQDVTLTYTLTRSDGGKIYGTTDKSQVSVGLNEDNHWTGGLNLGLRVDPYDATSNLVVRLPIIRSTEGDVKYVLKESAIGAPDTYYPIFGDMVGAAGTNLVQKNPAGTSDDTWAEFRLTSAGAIINVTNANAPYICKIDDGQEHPFRTLNAAVDYARKNLDGKATIEMLVDYDMPETDKVQLGTNDVVVGEETKSITDDIVLTTAAKSGGVYNYAGTGDAATIKRVFNKKSLFSVSNDADLTLGTITLDGNKGTYIGDKGGLVFVTGEGSTLTVKSGATLKDSKTDSDGGAIRVETKGAIADFAGTITGGEATSKDGSGGAISLASNTSATMSGGSITGNTAQKGAAVYVYGDEKEGSSSFTMTGGSITGNYAQGESGAVASNGANGKLFFSGDVTITGNTIDQYDSTVSNVYLESTGTGIINAAGLGTGASIGVYVKDKEFSDKNDDNKVKNLFDERGGVLDVFGSYQNPETGANVGKITNDRNGLTAVTTTGNKLMWQQSIKVEVRYIRALENYTSIPTRTVLYNNDAYTLSADPSNIDAIAADVYAKYGDQFGTGKTATMMFWRGYAADETEFGDRVYSLRSRLIADGTFTTDTGRWLFQKKNNIAVVGDTKLVLYYTEPTYITITNNSEYDTQNNANMTVLGQPVYGYDNVDDLAFIVKVDGADVEKRTVTQEDLSLKKGGHSVTMMVLGACGKPYTLNGGFIDVSNESRVKVTRTGEAAVTLTNISETYGNVWNYTFGGSVINTPGGVTEIVFGGVDAAGLTLTKQWQNAYGGEIDVPANAEAKFTIHQMKLVEAEETEEEATSGDLTVILLDARSNKEAARTTIANGNPITVKATMMNQWAFGQVKVVDGNGQEQYYDVTNHAGSNGTPNYEQEISPSMYQSFIDDNTVTLKFFRNNDADGMPSFGKAKTYKWQDTTWTQEVTLPDNGAWSTLVSNLPGGFRYYVTEDSMSPEGYHFDSFLDDFGGKENPIVDSGQTVTVINKKQAEYIARVSNDGGETWTYHEYLVNPADVTVTDGSTIKSGAFDQANRLTGDVIIETLLESHERYTLTKGYEFTNTPTKASITLRTTQDDEWNPAGAGHFTSIITRGFSDGDKETSGLIKLTAANTKFITEHIIFDGSQGNDGTTYTGRAFYVNGGALSIEDGTIMRHFKTTHNYGGGAIYQPKGSVQINNKHSDSAILFEDCNNGNEEGGAIRGLTTINVVNAGTLTFRNCIAGTGGAIETEASGAHIIINNTGTITIDTCTGGRWVGGAVCAYTGTSNVSITGTGTTEFKNCNSGSKEGGAIYAEGSVTLENVIFTNCSGSNGGGVYAGGAATLTNVTFGEPELNEDGTIKTDSNGYPIIKENTGCTATTSGGGLYAEGNIALTDCNFYYCKATDENGGAVFGKGDTTIKGSVFDHCEAVNGTGANTGLGGAVCLREDKALVIDQSASRRSAFIDCRANQYGGAVIYDLNGGTSSTFSHTDFIRCVATKETGGAIFTDAKKVAIVDCTFTDCKTTDSTVGGGALMLNAEGGGSDAIEIKDSSFSGCEAPNGNGGAIYFYNKKARELILTNVSIDGSSAKLGGAIYSKGDLTITGKSEIKSCAAEKGAAVYAHDGTSVTFEGGTETTPGVSITGNSSAGTDGGAVNVAKKTCKLFFEGNVLVYDNKGASGEQRNVCLEHDSNEIINVTAAGLGANAHIGIYVKGNMGASESEPYKSYGGYEDDFGTHTESATSKANLDRFTNDRNGLYGEACPVSGHTELIRWQSYLCKLTDADGKLLYKDTAHTQPAVYNTLIVAFGDAKKALYKKDGTAYEYLSSNAINVEMLRNYSQPANDAVTDDAQRSVTLTTASNTVRADDYFIYNKGDGTGVDDRKATITRDFDTVGSMMSVDNGATLNVASIVLDGANKHDTSRETDDTMDGDTVTAPGNYQRGGILHVEAGGALNVNDGVTLQNGKAARGGAIYGRGNTTINITGDAVIKSSVATTYGGGIYTDGTLTIAGTSATKKVTITNCSAADGGGIRTSEANNDVTISWCEISNCEANGASVPDGADPIPGSAGQKAITASGGGINAWTHNLTMTDSKITGCSSKWSGGGMTASGTVKLTRTEVIGNKAGVGAGILADSGTTLDLDNRKDENENGIPNGSKINNNTATSDGGGIYHIGSGQVTLGNAVEVNNNAATGNGGGLYLGASTTFKAVASTISRTDSGITKSATNGGGIYAVNSTVTLDGSAKIEGNIASTNDTESNTALGSGGAIFMDGGTLNLHGDTHVTNNQAKKGPGAANNDYKGCGGAIYLANSATMTMYAQGVLLQGNAAERDGGAVYASQSSKVNLNNGSIGGADTASANTAGRNGGGVYLVQSKATVKGGTIAGNTATSNGGGVYVANLAASLDMQGGTISGNKAKDGAGVCLGNDDSTFTMSGGTISGNTATANGGGVANRGTFTLSGGTISGNNAASGAGVFLNNPRPSETEASFTMSAGTISGNEASAAGSAVYVANGNADASTGAPSYVAMAMSGGEISGNTVSATVGAVQVGGENARLYFSGNAKVTGNTFGSGEGSNVYLDFDTNKIINATDLGTEAQIGVRVSEAQFANHGEMAKLFGTYTGEAKNLNHFVNDVRGYFGEKASATEVRWEYIPVPMMPVTVEKVWAGDVAESDKKPVPFTIYGIDENGRQHKVIAYDAADVTASTTSEVKQLTAADGWARTVYVPTYIIQGGNEVNFEGNYTIVEDTASFPTDVWNAPEITAMPEMVTPGEVIKAGELSEVPIDTYESYPYTYYVEFNTNTIGGRYPTISTLEIKLARKDSPEDSYTLHLDVAGGSIPTEATYKYYVQFKSPVQYIANYKVNYLKINGYDGLAANVKLLSRKQQSQMNLYRFVKTNLSTIQYTSSVEYVTPGKIEPATLRMTNSLKNIKLQPIVICKDWASTAPEDQVAANDSVSFTVRGIVGDGSYDVEAYAANTVKSEVVTQLRKTDMLSVGGTEREWARLVYVPVENGDGSQYASYEIVEDTESLTVLNNVGVWNGVSTYETDAKWVTNKESTNIKDAYLRVKVNNIGTAGGYTDVDRFELYYKDADGRYYHSTAKFASTTFAVGKTYYLPVPIPTNVDQTKLDLLIKYDDQNKHVFYTDSVLTEADTYNGILVYKGNDRTAVPKFVQEGKTDPNPGTATRPTFEDVGFVDALPSGATAVGAAEGKRLQIYTTQKLTVTNNFKVVGFDVSFMKVDGYGNPLGGATFTVYSDADCKEIKTRGSDNITSASLAQEKEINGVTYPAGTVLLEKVPTGVWYMMENKVTKTDGRWDSGAPEGYAANANRYVVLVGSAALTRPEQPAEGSVWAEDGVLADITRADVEAQTGAGDGAGNFAIFQLGTDGKAAATPSVRQFGIMNQGGAARTVILRKVGEGNAPLEGARFRIFRADLSEVRDESAGYDVDRGCYASDGSGLYFVGKLPEGRYYLVETQEPTKAGGEETGDYSGNRWKVFELEVRDGMARRFEADKSVAEEGEDPTLNAIRSLVNP